VKFSSFRQLLVSTIKDYSAVTDITVFCDGGQYGFQRSYHSLLSCFFHHLLMQIASPPNSTAKSFIAFILCVSEAGAHRNCVTSSVAKLIETACCIPPQRLQFQPLKNF